MDLLTVRHECGVAVIASTVRHLDAAVAPAFEQAAVQVIEGGATRVVLDLDQVDFLDAAGLGAILFILKALGRSGRMVLCNVRGSVLSVFYQTRVDQVIDIASSRDEAIARVAG